jgi:UDP-N-acetylglucosamine 2-epimerase (non-hydrolysing)
LLKEGIPNERIIVTGNTIVDAINLARVKDMEHPTKNNVLITCHRRENLNGNFDSLIESIHQIATENRELKFIWVSHFNPIVREKLSRLKSHQLSNIEIKEPLDLDNFYELYAQTKIIITDSGGIQEEAVSFKIPVVIIRNNTERVESINAGISKIAGTSYSDLKNAFHWGLNKQISNQDSLYGDGKAAVRIVDYLQNNL